jgi:hypothetical protein
MTMFCGLPVIVAVLPTLPSGSLTDRGSITLEPSDEIEHQRRHDQADCVVDEESRERACHQYDGHEQDERVAGRATTRLLTSRKKPERRRLATTKAMGAHRAHMGPIKGMSRRMVSTAVSILFVFTG